MTNTFPGSLFGIDHAALVLAAFGRAFGKLPESSSQISKDQKSFLVEAVMGLADDGKIVPVHLSLFAEMIEHNPGRRSLRTS